LYLFAKVQCVTLLCTNVIGGIYMSLTDVIVSITYRCYCVQILYVLYTSTIVLNKWQIHFMSVVISCVVEDYEDT
jgi:hypothetical protein